MAVVSVESAKGCGSADIRSIGRCDGGCLLFPVVPLSVFFFEVAYGVVYAVCSGYVSVACFSRGVVYALQGDVMIFEYLMPVLFFCFIVVAVFRFFSRVLGGFGD